jgi:hypothetical protein
LIAAQHHVCFGGQAGDAKVVCRVHLAVEVNAERKRIPVACTCVCVCVCVCVMFVERLSAHHAAGNEEAQLVREVLRQIIDGVDLFSKK